MTQRSLHEIREEQELWERKLGRVCIGAAILIVVIWSATIIWWGI